MFSLKTISTLLMAACLTGTSLLLHAQEENDGVRATYTPQIERDRVKRYQREDSFYQLQTGDIGTGTLRVELKESTVDGGERVHVAGDFTLNVQAVDSCDPATVTPLTPASGETLYNLLPQTENVVSSALFEGAFITSEGSESPLHSFTLLADAALSFTSNTSDNIPAVAIYRDDGSLADDDLEALVFNFSEATNLIAGDYLIAYIGTDDTSVWVNGSTVEYICYPCDSGSTNYSFNAVASAPVFQLDTGGSLLTSLPPQLRPLTFKVSAPSGVSAVSVAIAAYQANLTTSDGVIYTLDPNSSEGLDFYQQALFATPAATALDITTHTECGSTNTETIALTIALDPIPQPTINYSGALPLALNYGEQTHVAASLSDAGRNLSQVMAVLYHVGYIPSGDDLTVDHYQSAIVAELGQVTLIDLLDQAAARPLHQDSLLYQLPLSVRAPNVAQGNYELRLLAFDTLGQASASDPLATLISPPTIPPFLDVHLPDYRIPAGETFVLDIDTEHLGPLDRLEVQVSGVVVDTAINTDDLAGALSYAVQKNVRVLADAREGDLIAVNVTAIGLSGKMTSFIGQVEVGGWGERTVVIDSSSEVTVTDNSMRYADLIIDNQSLIHRDAAIRFNHITLQNGAILQAGEQSLDADGNRVNQPLTQLSLNGHLAIDSSSLLRVAAFDSLNQASNGGGAHGGDAANDNTHAYGNITVPIYPGGSGASTISGNGNVRASGGGALEILAQAITVNGQISANGDDAFSLSSSLGSHAGAGGALLIRTGQLNGSGEIHANGGNGIGSALNTRQSGAGGRVAIYYQQYGDGSVALQEGMTLQAYSGSAQAVSFVAGVGTLYLKHTAQDYGDLILQPQNGYIGTATSHLPSVGRHLIDSVESLGNDQYRIVVSTNPWLSQDNNLWQAGLQGLKVSLDASDRDSALYDIISNAPSSFIVSSADALNTATLSGNTLTGVLRMDHIIIGDGVRLVSDDVLYGSAFSINDTDALNGVAQVRSNQVFDLGDYNGSDAAVYVGDVNARSMLLTAASTRIFGELNNSGALQLENDADLVVGGSLSAQSLQLNQQAQLMIDGLLSVTNHVTLDGTTQLTVAADFTASSLSLRDTASLIVQGHSLLRSDLSLVGDVQYDTGSAIFEGVTHLDNNAALTITVNGEMSGMLEMTAASLSVGAQLTVHDEARISEASTLTANDVELLNDKNFLVSGSFIDIANVLDVSGAISAAGAASLNVNRANARVVQLDGSIARVTLASTYVESIEALVAISSDIRPYTNPQNEKHPLIHLLSQTSSVLIGSDATVDFSDVALATLHADLFPLCASSATIAMGSHAGVATNTSVDDCVYGRYDVANLPGSQIGSAGGGGVVLITSPTANIQGQINVNGGDAAATAGGSVVIDATVFSGNGIITANGGNDNSSAGGGGRILASFDNGSGYRGQLSAFGGVSSSNVAGAGTILLVDKDDTTQQLIIDNNQHTAAVSSTPVRAVGQHTITAVNALSSNTWQLTVGSASWPASNATHNQGLVGRFVSVNAADIDAPLYRIVSNTASTLTVESLQDLSSSVGQTLIGQHNFSRLTVTGGAYADFENDRVVVDDVDNSDIDIARINASSDSVLE